MELVIGIDPGKVGLGLFFVSFSVSEAGNRLVGKKEKRFLRDFERIGYERLNLLSLCGEDIKNKNGNSSFTKQEKHNLLIALLNKLDSLFPDRQNTYPSITVIIEEQAPSLSRSAHNFMKLIETAMMLWTRKPKCVFIRKNYSMKNRLGIPVYSHDRNENKNQSVLWWKSKLPFGETIVPESHDEIEAGIFVVDCIIKDFGINRFLEK